MGVRGGAHVCASARARQVTRKGSRTFKRSNCMSIARRRVWKPRNRPHVADGLFDASHSWEIARSSRPDRGRIKQRDHRLLRSEWRRSRRR